MVRKVLIIDDQPDLREEMARFVTRLGDRSHRVVRDIRQQVLGEGLATAAPASPEMHFHVETAASGEAGLALVRQAHAAGDPFTLAFVDMRMPGGWNGLETMLQLWQVEGRLHVILCSAYADISWEDMVVAVGHRDNLLILKKPFDEMALAQLVLAFSEKAFAEQQLLALNRSLTDIFASLPFMLVLVGPDGLIHQWNRGAEIMTSIPSATAVGRNLLRDVPLLAACREVLAEHLGGGLALDDYTFTWVDGAEDRNYRVSLYPLGGALPTVGGAVIRVEDATDAVKKDEYLRQSQKMETVGNLAAGIAHDFNNVIGSVGATLDGIQFSLDRAESLDGLRGDLAPDLAVIEEAVQRGSEMVAQLMGLSRSKEAAFARLDLNPLIGNAYRLCRKSLDLAVTPEIITLSEPAWIDGDEGMLSQVFINLFINASHAMTIMRPEGQRHGGRLTVSLTRIEVGKNILSVMPDIRPGEYWVVTVTDTGIGMDEATKARIFDPFFTTKGKGQGSGLGLSMVYYIIRQHRGFIQVDSRPGKETTFLLFLPACDPGVTKH
jgi:signal transduction histidine kinase